MVSELFVEELQETYNSFVWRRQSTNLAAGNRLKHLDFSFISNESAYFSLMM